jgi:hypothetical protein
MVDDNSGPESNAGADGLATPEFEVWNHLWSGLDMAYHDLEETLGDDAARLFDSLGDIVYKALTRLFVDPSDPSLGAKLMKEFPGLVGVKVKQAALLQSMLRAYKTGSWPVLKYSVDLQLGSEAISRAQHAFDRLQLLAGVLSKAPLPAGVREYLSEVVHTFLFGFDAASMALARSAFEQMAREVLVHKGIYTRGRLDRERPTAFNLLSELTRNGLIGATVQRAEALVRRSNTISHKHVYEGRIMQQLALTSITELAQVLTELADHLPTPPEPAG